MDWIAQHLWLIPVGPLVAAALTAVAKRSARKWAAAAAIGSMLLAFVLSCVAFSASLQYAGQVGRFLNFDWLVFGDPGVNAATLRLGWILDPLSAVMLVMVSFVGLLIFIYSVGYLAADENFTRFFCFLSLFAAAMLGLVIANSLLLLFICWELVGLTSYLLIGFWYHKPSAAAAAKKAFITTRIGDLALLLGMLWLYAQTGTLLFYDGGRGCLEQSALAGLTARGTALGMAASTGIALLIFCGAIGKSGQVPLHVWLPDAMEGPTPVSALIHAATMVAAGVFLIARVYPLMAVQVVGSASTSAALQVVTWIGAITAVFAATIAVAQTDIKRILAYSTVSQLGFMMLGLGVGGVAVGMFHLITHAFFKALLFLGAGSVIHGCHEEQDIRRMGGLRKWMPVTFATYAIGMLALSGFPLVVSGFWSKDAILHAAHAWKVSHLPFWLGVFGALLTAFYMTRQVVLVFFGERPPSRPIPEPATQPESSFSLVTARSASSPASAHPHDSVPHESPPVMTVPLVILAAFAILPGFLGTPAWPWFQTFLEGGALELQPARIFANEALFIILISTVVVFAGMGLGYWLYGRRPLAETSEPLAQRWPEIFHLLQRKYFIDEIYEASLVPFCAAYAKACDWLDRYVWNGVVQLCSYVTIGLSWVSRAVDEYVVNLGFDEACRRITRGGWLMSRLQDGRAQHYLRMIAVGVSVLILVLLWGRRGL